MSGVDVKRVGATTLPARTGTIQIIRAAFPPALMHPTVFAADRRRPPSLPSSAAVTLALGSIAAGHWATPPTSQI